MFSGWTWVSGQTADRIVSLDTHAPRAASRQANRAAAFGVSAISVAPRHSVRSRGSNVNGGKCVMVTRLEDARSMLADVRHPS